MDVSLIFAYVYIYLSIVDIGAFTVSSDGKRLYIGGSDTIQVYSVETSELRETLPDPFNRKYIYY